ncbi:recombinase family protein [Paenibacillus naphthalenovorans]|uniref:recombinase family protein n=1 Tax=Paenibacillus naphthalenovorans TaxID=162209 RepID=UPI0010B287EB|nr:recombinase family protein [Paenibacillus naphthalenovorans]GCL71748.1 recombinase family protein [Paenibacillus naphthalenovorans]
MERVAIYLRKSRADMEAEMRGEGETLAKHKKALLRFAKERNLNIIKIREEIVSGESLLHRPEMQELLREVDSGLYDGVLVMDMDRLGRGNMQEQGLILETFRNANTLIITPLKTYDLRNEMDETMSEFQAFFARHELKTITRRMQGGRKRSVQEGNYIATRPPYGYQIHKTDRERFLVPDPEQANIVRLIFDWYANGIEVNGKREKVGANKIALELNKFCRTYTGGLWKSSSVLNIIKNPVYIGRIQWGRKEQKKSTTPGKQRDIKSRPKEEWIDAKGKHEPLISEELFNQAQKILKGKYHVPYQLENGITNPLAGLIRCGYCNSSMVLRPYTNQPAHIKCYNQFCVNRSSRAAYVEEKLLWSLEQWLAQLKIELKERKNSPINMGVEARQTALKTLERELSDTEKQKGSLHDYLEKGIYSVETYLERSKILAERTESIKQAIEKIKSEIQNEMTRANKKTNIVPKIKSILKLYHKTKDPAKKNEMLKSIVDFAVYRKEKWQRNDQFVLELHPSIER